MTVNQEMTLDFSIDETSPHSGVRTITAVDRRTPLLEFEIGISAAGTTVPDGRTLAALLVAEDRWPALQRETAESGGGAAVSHRGEWMLITGRLLPFSDQWLDEVSTVLRSLAQTIVDSSEALAGIPVSHPMDAAWEAAKSTRGWEGSAYAVLVGVDLDEIAGRLAGALGGFHQRVRAGASRERRTDALPPRPSSGQEITWLAGAEPTSAGSEAERFLATALLTSPPTSHLLQKLERDGSPFTDFTIGRDVYAGTPRVFAAARVPSGDADEFAAWVRDAVDRAGRWAPDAERGRALVNYCRANIAEAFESPRALCDGLGESARRGARATWLNDMMRGILEVDLEVAAASADALCRDLGTVRAKA